MALVPPSKIAKSTKSARVPEKVYKMLNDQIKIELEASQIYYAMGEWCEENGYFGGARLFKEHSDEERGHMSKVYKYIQDREGEAITPDVEAPVKQKFVDLKEAIEVAYDHEKYVTDTYNDLAKLSMLESDFATFQFALGFLKEQVEEESKFKNMLDEIGIMGDNKRDMYLFDKSLMKD